MVPRFRSPEQESLFGVVLKHLGSIGYNKGLLRTEYRFGDFFSEGVPEREVGAAAFGQTPTGYDSACFAIAIANGKSGAELIREYRALGAPCAFEVREREVAFWRVGAETTAADCLQTVAPDRLDRLFRENAEWWKPERLFSAKNIGAESPHQLDFIDLGLIPALEKHVRERLDPLLEGVLGEASEDYAARAQGPLDPSQLYRLVFRALYGKVLWDRGLLKAPEPGEVPASGALLDYVAEHFGDDRPVLSDPQTQQLVVGRLWKGVNCKNLSVEALAFVWENTLVSDELRSQRSIHATHQNVARYIVRRLPLAEIPANERRITEPCCGSGTFLIAAMQRLRELLPPDTGARTRHSHFVKMLSGVDVESFGLEVARPCLMLADFPNPNGWRLYPENVFGTPEQSPAFYRELRRARVVLCNPPFEAFPPEDRERYGAKSPNKPVELLRRILRNLRPDAMLGLVLPTAVIDGKAYRPVRKRLAQRFSHLELVWLPEGAFRKARHPAALLIAKHPRENPATVRVSYSTVESSERFLRTGEADRTLMGEKTAQELETSLAVFPLGDLWQHLAGRPTLGDVALIRRGVEWENFDSDRHISPKPKRGYVPGYHTADEIYCFEPPPLAYLWNKKEDRKYKAWDLPWHLPKVVCNAVRRTEGPWRLATCPVEANVLCTQNFTVVWPQKPWTMRTLSAVLNGPVACAFVATHEVWKHVKKETYAAIPLPELTDNQRKRIEGLVKEYQHLAAIRRDFGSEDTLFGRGQPTAARLRALLSEIDRETVRGYQLPPRLEEELLHFFAGAKRPVPFAYPSSGGGSPAPGGASDSREDWELLKRALGEDNLSGRQLFR